MLAEPEGSCRLRAVQAFISIFELPGVILTGAPDLRAKPRYELFGVRFGKTEEEPLVMFDGT